MPRRGGTVSHRAGLYAGTGPAVKPLSGPVGTGRQQPPPPARGRTASLRGTRGGTGPAVRVAAGPVRAKLPVPVLPGRHRGTGPVTVFIPPPAFRGGSQ